MHDVGTKIMGSGLGGAMAVPDFDVPDGLRYVVWALLVYQYALLPAILKTYEVRRDRRSFKAGG